MPQHPETSPRPAASPGPADAQEPSVDKACESVAGEEDPGAADDPTSHSSALPPPPVPPAPTDPRKPAGPPA